MRSWYLKCVWNAHWMFQCTNYEELSQCRPKCHDEFAIIKAFTKRFHSLITWSGSCCAVSNLIGAYARVLHAPHADVQFLYADIQVACVTPWPLNVIFVLTAWVVWGVVKRWCLIQYQRYLASMDNSIRTPVIADGWMNPLVAVAP